MDLFINKNVIKTGFHCSLGAVHFYRPYCFALILCAFRLMLCVGLGALSVMLLHYITSSY